MQSSEFNSVIRDQIQRSFDVLHDKNEAYNPDQDKLATFKKVAGLRGQSARRALAGMMSKHTVSVYDLCEAEQPADLDIWNEKITDHINYLLLLRAVVEEEIVENSNVEDREAAIAQLREKLTATGNTSQN